MCNTVTDKPAEAVGGPQKDGLSEEFLMFSYKVVPCGRRYPHDWASCPCGHKGERASRRDIRTHPYLAIACSYAKQRQTCPRGDSCLHAHNLFEYWLHPQRYRTELCQYGSNCERPVCFFAHGMEELRLLYASLPPAETCWSAGAAMSAKSRAQVQAATYQQQQHMAMGANTVVAAAAAAAAAAQMQATACAASLQHVYTSQIPVSGLGMVPPSAAAAASEAYLLLQHQQQLMFMGQGAAVTAGQPAAAVSRELSLLASRQQQQLTGSPLHAAAMLPSSNMWLTASTASGMLCGSLAAAAAAPEHFSDTASSSSNISSSWSTSSMVDCSTSLACNLNMSPAAAAAAAASMLRQPASTLPGSGPLSAATQLSGASAYSNAWTVPSPAIAASNSFLGRHPLGLLPAQATPQQQHGLPSSAALRANGSPSLDYMLSALQEMQLQQYM